jgi:hypothetical protein
LSSSYLPKKVKIKIYRTTNFPVILYDSKTWSLKLTVEDVWKQAENLHLKRLK